MTGKSRWKADVADLSRWLGCHFCGSSHIKKTSPRREA